MKRSSSFSPFRLKGFRLALPSLMGFIVLLQMYHVYYVDLSSSTPSNSSFHSPVKDTGTTRLSNDIVNMNNQDRISQSSYRRLRSSTHPNNDEEESFSACLMMMDDNAHLIEWLAYHYTKLPLRRLIVAVDPRSVTSPTSILDRWTGRMNITQWSEVDFMPPHMLDTHKHIDDTDHTALTDLFRQRQEHFYTRCMARLKYEGRTWTAFVDTDEYILINENAMNGHRVVPLEEQHSPRAKQMTILDSIHLMTNTTTSTSQTIDKIIDLSNNSPVDSTKTTTDTITALDTTAQSSTHKLTSPCLAMARVAFGVKESDPDVVQRNVPTLFPDMSLKSLFGGSSGGGSGMFFDGRDFQTLRWRYHSGRGAKKTNKISKSLLDVSQVESSLFIPHEQVMVHLPSKKYCHTGAASTKPGTSAAATAADGSLEQHLWVLNGHSPIVVHHYSGTWEQWSHRKDTRNKRTWENYQKMAYDKSTDDHIRPWLQQFVNQVGFWKARQLLADVGKVP